MSPDGSIKPPPEEKLLRLIRAKQARPASEAGTAAASAHAVPAPLALLTGVAERAVKGQIPWPKLAAAGLAAALGIEVLWLLVQLLRPLPPVALPAVQDAAQTEERASAAPEALPSLAGSVSRPLFAASGGSSAPAEYRPPSAPAKGLASRLSLMGIVSGDPPQAIIEDSETKKTYFVTTGQPIVEGAVLEQVLDNRVVLSLDGERIELSL